MGMWILESETKIKTQKVFVIIERIPNAMKSRIDFHRGILSSNHRLPTIAVSFQILRVHCLETKMLYYELVTANR